MHTDTLVESCSASSSLTTTQEGRTPTSPTGILPSSQTEKVATTELEYIHTDPTSTDNQSGNNNIILLQRTAIGSTIAALVIVITVAAAIGIVIKVLWMKTKRNEKTIIAMTNTNTDFEAVIYPNPAYDGR